MLGALPRCANLLSTGMWTRLVMNVLRIILGDQLSLEMSALDDLDPRSDVVLMMEVMEENTYVGHHKQKIGCCQSNANQSPNIKIMRISRRQLTPFGHGRSAVLLECFAWGEMTFEIEMIVD